MRLFKPSTLADSFGIDVDSEGIGLNTVMQRAYQRALFATGDLNFAERHATSVTLTLANQWEREAQHPSPDDGGMGYFAQPNRAFQIEIVSFTKLNNYKSERLKDHIAGRRKLHKDSLAKWFVDHLVNYGLRRHSGYAGTCTLKVLFNYTYRDLEETLELIDEKWDSSFQDRKDQLRRWKKKIFKDLTNWFGSVISTTRTSEDSFTEHRFRHQPVTLESLNDVFGFMNFLTPLRPACAFTASDTVELYDLQSILTAHAISPSLHAVERERIHLMNHAKDLFGVLKELGTTRALKSPDQALELPEFAGVLPNSNSGPPSRREVPYLEDEQKQRIEREVIKRRRRIRRLVSKSIQIVVDNEMRMKLDLDQPKKCELTLNEGDSLLEIQASDHAGPLPLSTLFIPWNPRLMVNDILTYRVSLQRGKEILFVINYDRNESGDFEGATLDIHYSPRVEALAMFASMRDLIRFAPSGTWVPRFVVAVLLVGIVVGIFWYSRRTVELNNVTNQPASQIDSHPSPLPTATAQQAHIDSTPPRDESPPPQHKMTSSERRELLAQANVLNLERYTTAGERGSQATRATKPLFAIYASRTQTTRVRIYLDEETPISSVELKNAFLGSVAPGKVESSTRTSVTVQFDLRTVRRGEYFLAVSTSLARPPKHYLIRIL